MSLAVPAAQFVRIPGGALLTGGVSWEKGALQEPCVFKDGATWKMWYHGGWTAADGGIGYATCTGDPSVPANWTKYAGNPVLGQGGSGVTGTSMRATVLKDGSTYYCYYTDNLDLWHATSSDGINWNTPTKVLTHGTPSYVLTFQNSELIRFGATDWRLLVECGITGLGITWGTIAYTSTSPSGPWTQIGNGIINTLAVPGNTQAWVSNPNYLGVVDGEYVMAYHSGPSGYSFIYIATSTDFVTWTRRGEIIWPLRSGVELDQAADVCIVADDDRLIAYYSGVNNVGSASRISASTYDGTLSDFLSESATAPTPILGQDYPWVQAATSSGITANTIYTSGPHVASADGGVDQLYVYLNPNTSGPAVVRGVIYADNAGAPGDLVAVGEETTIPAGAAAGGTSNWYPLPFASQPSMEAGSSYWLGVWTGSAGVSVWRQTTTAMSYAALKSSKSRTTTYNQSADPSDPFGAGTAVTNSELSIYATLVPQGPSNVTVPLVYTPVDVTLTASEGTWTRDPTSFTYQWQYSLDGSTAAGDIAGETSSTYVTADTDVDHWVRCGVVAMNDDGVSEAAYSDWVGPISEIVPTGVPVNEIAPVLAGAFVGQTLTSNTGIWGEDPTEFTYQWQVSDDFMSWSDIGGATSASYVVTSSTLGKYVRCSVTASNDVGTGGAAPSGPLGPIEAAPPPPTPRASSPGGSMLPGGTTVYLPRKRARKTGFKRRRM